MRLIKVSDFSSSARCYCNIFPFKLRHDGAPRETSRRRKVVRVESDENNVTMFRVSRHVEELMKLRKILCCI